MEANAVAIIGMAGRFPGAPSIDTFWQRLLDGADCITRRPPLFSETGGCRFVHAYGRLEDIYEFDHRFFDISASEAKRIEPQERLLLTCAYHALEDAGYAGRTTNQTAGLICGAPENEAYIRSLCAGRMGNRVEVATEKFMYSGISLAGRIAWKLNLTGPCMSVNTACSTSLTAVLLAADMVAEGRADMMLAGATNVAVDQTGYVQVDGMSASDGVVRPFDADSTGFVPGSGVGLVVLKRYRDAVADGDQIYAVIAGGAMTNDGNRKVGYTAPSVQGECDAVVAALSRAGIRPDDIGYIEAHGTATVLGDSIEARALSRAFGGPGERQIPVGSLKGNFGHLNSAAGIAGLMKTALILKYQILPPSIHVRRENPELVQGGRFEVCRSRRVLASDNPIRYAGVSSFGIGGMNTHIVLQRHVPDARLPLVRPAELFLVSAGTSEALTASLSTLRERLSDLPAEPADAAYTLACRRPPYACRGALIRSEDGSLDCILAGSGPRALEIDCGSPAAADLLSDCLPGFAEAFRAAGGDSGRAATPFAETELSAFADAWQMAWKQTAKRLGLPFREPGGDSSGRSDRDIGQNSIFSICMTGTSSKMTAPPSEPLSGSALWKSLLQLVGGAWVSGALDSADGLFFENRCRVCRLPGYCFSTVQHRPDWCEAELEGPDEADTGDRGRDLLDFEDLYRFLGEEARTADRMGPETALDDLYVDSMLVLVLKSKIADRYGCVLSVRDFYDCETVGDIEHLIRIRAGAAGSLSNEEERPASPETFDSIDDWFEAFQEDL